MELASLVPTELSGSAALLDRAAPDSLTSADDQAAATALPFSFAQLLQSIDVLPQSGDALPQSGNDLPLSAEAAQDPSSGCALLQPAFALLNPLVPPMVTTQPAPTAAGGTAASSLAPQAAAGGALALPPTAANALAPPGDAFQAATVAAEGTNVFTVADIAADGSSAFAAADGAAGAAVASADDASATAPTADALRAANTPAPGAHAAGAAAVAAADRQDAAALGPAAAPLAGALAGQPADHSQPARPRVQTRSTERALASIASIDAPRLEANANAARSAPASALIPDATAAATAADLQSGSQLAPPALTGVAPLGGEGVAGAGHAAGQTFAHSIGAASAAQPVTGAAAAAGPDTVFGQGTAQALDTTTPRWNDALAGRIHWMVDHDVGEARIKLNPPELGALDVKISLVDDKTYVQLAAHNSAARDELAQSLPRLRELLAANGLQLGGATVSDGRDQQSARNAPAEGGGMPRDFAALADSTESQVRATRRGATQIDLFA